MFMGLVAAQRAAAHVAGVDFLMLFTGGMVFGIGVSELIRWFRDRRAVASEQGSTYATFDHCAFVARGTTRRQIRPPSLENFSVATFRRSLPGTDKT